MSFTRSGKPQTCHPNYPSNVSQHPLVTGVQKVSYLNRNTCTFVLSRFCMLVPRLAKSWSIGVLIGPVVKTGHYWSIGGQLKWLIGSIKSWAYMPLSFIHNCQCCSLAAAKVLSDLLNQALAVHLCENIVMEALQQSIKHMSIAIFNKKNMRKDIIAGFFRYLIRIIMSNIEENVLIQIF